ncbi:MAG: HU family DNA-binding protein [Bacteroidaceae bacterium]|nr:HU family DNA-binding protein [Bacteroidaceae bacterium]
MTNKEFMEKVSTKTSFEMEDVKVLSAVLTEVVLDQIVDGNSVAIQGFGVFEPREKARRKMYNPTSKSFIVVPSKTTLGYKMSAALKDRLNME